LHTSLLVSPSLGVVARCVTDGITGVAAVACVVTAGITDLGLSPLVSPSWVVVLQVLLQLVSPSWICHQLCHRAGCCCRCCHHWHNRAGCVTNCITEMGVVAGVVTTGMTEPDLSPIVSPSWVLLQLLSPLSSPSRVWSLRDSQPGAESPPAPGEPRGGVSACPGQLPPWAPSGLCRSHPTTSLLLPTVRPAATKLSTAIRADELGWSGRSGWTAAPAPSPFRQVLGSADRACGPTLAEEAVVGDLRLLFESKYDLVFLQGVGHPESGADDRVQAPATNQSNPPAPASQPIETNRRNN
jgi:hypothetical protein